MEINKFKEWTFVREIEIPDFVKDVLIEGEEAKKAYTTIRDTALFTNKRLIVVDVQGITGKKKEIYSIPYKSILMFSSENAGHIDINSEVSLWTRLGLIKINLKRDINVREFDKLIAKACL